MARTDGAVDAGFPVGIVPSGTANAMATELDGYRAKTYISLIGTASLMAAEGKTRKVDMISVQTPSQTVCGLVRVVCRGYGPLLSVRLESAVTGGRGSRRPFRARDSSSDALLSLCVRAASGGAWLVRLP